jgi:hypothetical protein
MRLSDINGSFILFLSIYSGRFHISFLSHSIQFQEALASTDGFLGFSRQTLQALISKLNVPAYRKSVFCVGKWKRQIIRDGTAFLPHMQGYNGLKTSRVFWKQAY